MLKIDPHPGIILSLCIDEHTLIQWRVRDQVKAQADGWYLDEEDGMITKDDDSSAFPDSNAAIDHVTALATAGDECARRAMIFHNHSNMMAWVKEPL